MQLTRHLVQAPTPIDYLWQKGTDAVQTPVYLLLHGFGERAKRLLRQWGPLFEKDVHLVIPNAPYPLPKREVDPETQRPFYKIGFAWYFYDEIKDEFLIDYQYPAKILQQLLKDLNLDKNPLCIIGYSQGGYLSPFAGALCENTRHVIGVNCRFREDMLPSKIDFQLDALHAQEDSKVDFSRAQAAFEKLRQRGVKGSFRPVPGLDHELGPEINQQLSMLLKKHRALLE